MIDRYIQSPPQGWPAWCETEIRKADFVLMVCTATYLRRVNGEEEQGKGYGVLWEARLIRQHLYDEGAVSDKFVPVLLAGGVPTHVPTPVRGASIYPVETAEGYEALLRLLTNQPATPIPPLGQRRHLPRRQRSTHLPLVTERSVWGWAEKMAAEYGETFGLVLMEITAAVERGDLPAAVPNAPDEGWRRLLPSIVEAVRIAIAIGELPRHEGIWTLTHRIVIGASEIENWLSGRVAEPALGGEPSRVTHAPRETEKTVPERVADFLKGQAGDPFCDDCVAQRLSLARRQQAQQATSALGASSSFQRAMGICGGCGGKKTVTRSI